MCGKSFTSNSNLEKHKRAIHQGLRPHQCNMCDKSFPNASAMKRHSISHTGEKAYNCGMCGNAFDRLSDLKTHEQECVIMEDASTSDPETSCNIKVEP